MGKIDLHIHSTASDGKLTPSQIIDLAVKNDIKAIAITDHDNLNGLKEAIEYSKGRIEFVPGVEFSADPKELAKEIHIVGLFIDPYSKEIKNLLEVQKNARIRCNQGIIKKLNDLGYEITYDEAKELKGSDEFGRPTMAQLLIKKYSRFKDRKQVFDELLGKGGKAFCKDDGASIKDIISVIHCAGGVAILAHPAYLFDNAEVVLKDFIKNGGDGIEVDCFYGSFGEDAQKMRDKFREIAKQNNLLISGGTDFHELNDKIEIGSNGVSEEEFNRLKEHSLRINRHL